MELPGIDKEQLRMKVRASLEGQPFQPPAMNLLGVVFDRERAPQVQQVMEAQHVFLSMLALGRGTANNRILGFLGLGESEKAVLLSILPELKARAAMQGLDKMLDFSRPGHGVSFICPVSEGCYHKVVHTGPTDKEGDTMQSQSEFDLIIVVTSRGYTEDVMEAARAAGATGGTVIHARGCGSAAEKFFGITIQPEKELVFILSKAEGSCAIMESISQNAGPGTDANAVSFSLPASHVRGIGLDVPDEIARGK